MNWIPGIFRRRKLHDDLSEEIRLHIEERVEQLMSEGQSPQEARRRACIAFGNPALVEERSREVWQWPTLESILADARFALCVDVLAPEGYGEVIGGSQRVSSFELLNARIEHHNLPKEAFQWYLDLRRYGSVPHSGFGMGIERAVAWICGLDHVRETIPFARTLHRIYP